MGINQGALPECPDYNFVIDENAPKERQVIIVISEGEFEDVAFNLYDMKIVEAEEEGALLQFEYDIVDLEGILAEKSLVKIEANPDRFQEVVCSVVNSILMESIDRWKK